ncbi:MAG: competence protein CoiA [Candidatus Wallbacteria bacterium HGW-Wallbacteria-1]|jgi:competence protein CoiA|uniref:Competence protein CoiA n=1 Tax=Candidatus Wallbacteria bacterium HGW-Wallbacteria-1 TaxID=2013854 RepID=A0A2N1PKG6_9BACT|nr:MAG: competence protein CoiA [Candidatus Wallbacteria bacterium HGW-Wallbacteria-1]
MLTAIIEASGRKIIAGDSYRVLGPFKCPGCGREVILRKGEFKLPHFAHRPPHTCPWGEGESEIHLLGKSIVYNILEKHGHYVTLDLEKDFGRVVADVFVAYRGIAAAFEIQRSRIPVSEFIRRTTAYAAMNVHVLWLVPFSDEVLAEGYSPSICEKWLHALYFGRVYYLRRDGSVLPVHFDEYTLTAPGGMSLGADGELVEDGPMEYRSKRYRTPLPGKTLDLSTHFRRCRRSSWKGGSIEIPSCLVLMDKLKKWW